MNPISSLRILPAEAEAPTIGSANEAPGFRDILHSTIDDVEQLQTQAESKISGVLTGTGADVHSAMIAVERADLSFQLMMQVRNKIVSAYEEISRMQF